MIEKLTGKIIQWRWMVTAATLGAVVLATAGLRGIYFESDYRSKLKLYALICQFNRVGSKT